MNKTTVTSIDASRASASSRAREQEAPPPAEGALPLIRHSPGDLPQSIQQAEAALISQGAGIYQRSGQLARVMQLEAETQSPEGVLRSAGSTVITLVEQDYLTLALARCARFQRYNMREKSWLDCDPPARITAAYMANAGGWGLPHLRGIITAPTLRSDGTLLAVPGYDAASALYAQFDPQPFRPYLEVKPTREAALAALATLREVFRESAFAEGPESPYASVALAALVTACVRSALPIAPAFAISSNKASTGKTTIAKIAGQIATGVAPPAYPYTGDEQETRKALLAVLMTGDTTLLLDNVDTPVNSASLCMILTSTRYKDRLLGRNKTVDLPTNVTVFLTGNGLEVVGDLTTRVLLCKIDPELEHPEDRAFARDIGAYITQHRGKLLTAALLIPLAYLAAGEPALEGPRTRFPDWDRFVRRPLLWLGVADPMLTQADLRSEDPVRESLLAVLHAWHATYEERPATVARAVEDAQALGQSARTQLLEALQGVASGEKGGPLNTRRLGRYLKRNIRRIEAGMRLEDCGQDPLTHRRKFRVVRVTGVTGVFGVVYNPSCEFGNAKNIEWDSANTDNTGNAVTPDQEPGDDIPF